MQRARITRNSERNSMNASVENRVSVILFTTCETKAAKKERGRGNVMDEYVMGGRGCGKTKTLSEMLEEAMRKRVLESVDARTLSTGFVMNPIYKVEADGFATGGLIPKSKPEVHFWEDCKIQRNGKYTTVIWKDGTVTRVTCQDSDDPDDLRAFEEALAKKLYGSRTALKKFVEGRTVDVWHRKRKLKKQKKNSNEEKRTKVELIACDGNGTELSIGDTVCLEFESTCCIYRVRGIGDCTIKVKEGWNYLPSECFTKVRTEPPYSVGDWVVFRNPKENYLVHSEAWTSHMVADKPLKIEKINGTNLLCNDGCVYESLWIRGAEKTEEDTEE